MEIHLVVFDEYGVVDSLKNSSEKQREEPLLALGKDDFWAAGGNGMMCITVNFPDIVTLASPLNGIVVLGVVVPDIAGSALVCETVV